MNRWKKKSREKRQKLLKDAVPDLTDCQWFLPRYTFTPESKVAMGRSQARRCQLLLPWLSVEVLKMNPAVLFGLLHNRMTYPPQDWAPYNSRQLILSWACGHFDVEFSSKCVIVYGPKYGELVDWLVQLIEQILQGSPEHDLFWRHRHTFLVSSIKSWTRYSRASIQTGLLPQKSGN